MPHLSPKTTPTAALALGTMNFGKRTPEPDALRIVARALDAGITVLDTANVYTDGASERIVGKAARGKDVCVATKVGLARVGGRAEGLGAAAIRAACDASLGRLGRDTIDLYYLHAPDPETPEDDTLAALASLFQAGKIRAWGVSNMASWQILSLRLRAPTFGLPAPAVAQQLYNPLVRQLDVEYFRYTTRHPLHTTVYNPLAGGLLAGAYRYADTAPKGSRFDKNALYRRRYWQSALFGAVDTLRAIAEDLGLSLLDLAYAYVLGHPGVDSVLVGPATLAHLDDALAARAREVAAPLSAEARTRVEAVYTHLVGTDARYAR